MSKLKKKNSAIAKGGVYKPLISASLAIALGVSVASAATNGIITKSEVINGDQTISNTSGFATTSDSTNTAGLLFGVTGVAATITMNGTLEINGSSVTAGSGKKVHGIYVDSSNTKAITFTTSTPVDAKDFKTILIKSITGNSIYNNSGDAESTVTFKNVGIVADANTTAAGTFAQTKQYGIYSKLSAAGSYAFGSSTAKTVFEGTDATKSFSAIVLAQTGGDNSNATTLGGNVTVTGAAGAAAASSTTGVGIGGANGKNGQSVAGIEVTATSATNVTIDSGGLNLTLTGGAGGAGNASKGGVDGIGGSATGILIASDAGATTISGEDITLSLTAGAGNTAQPAEIYAIKNLSSNKLDLSGVSLFVTKTDKPSTADTEYAIYSNIAGVNYNFGTTAGTTISVSNSATDAVGVAIKANATFAGTLNLTADGTTTATGIQLASETTLDARDATLNLQVGNANATNAVALDMTGATFLGGFTVDGTNNVIGKSGTSSNTEAAILIKNSGISFIKSGSIVLEKSGGLVAKSPDGTTKILDNKGQLTFGGTSAAENASLVLGDDSAFKSTNVAGLYVDLADPSLYFGSGNMDNDGAAAIKTIFNVYNDNNDAYGAYVATGTTQTTLKGRLVLNTTATGASHHSIGFYSEANQTLDGNDTSITINAQSSNGASSIGFATGSAAQTLTFNEGAGNTYASISITSDSNGGDAIGMAITGGKLTVKTSETTTEGTSSTNTIKLLDKITLTVGQKANDKANASRAVGIVLSNNGEIAGDVVIGSGNTITAAQDAIALYVDTDGVLTDQSVKVADGVLDATNKYVIYSAKDLTFTNDLTTTSKGTYTITGGDDASGTYGLYNSIADGIYSFQGTSTTFTVTGTAGTPEATAGGTEAEARTAANGGDASAVIIKAATTIDTAQTLTLKATGGDGATNAATNGGSAIGLDIQAGSLTITGDTPAVAITANGGAAGTTTGGTQGTNGDATGIKLASETTLDASNATLNLNVGKTNATTAIALDMAGATSPDSATTFKGSFTVDQLNNPIGNSSATSATLIKNTGESTIQGSIVLKNSGLSGKTKTILNNTGVLTFEGSSASLAIGVTDKNPNLAYSYYGLYSNSSEYNTLNFGSGNGVKTVFNVVNPIKNTDSSAVSTKDLIGATGAVLLKDTTFEGNVEFNVQSATGWVTPQPSLSGSNIFTTGDAKGIEVAGPTTLNLLNSSLSLNVDTNQYNTTENDGSNAYGFYIKGGTFNLKGDNASLTLKVGTKNAKDAYGFYVGNTGIFNTDLIDLSDQSSATIGNTEGADTTATAVAIGTDATQTNGFTLLVGEGVLNAKTNYVFQNLSSQNVTFTTSETSSQKIIAGTLDTSDKRIFGLYSGLENVNYNFGTTGSTTFDVSSTSGDAYGAIIAADATFEGTAKLQITSEASNAVGVLLEDTSTYSGALSLGGDSTITAKNGEAIALQAAGTHIINDSITVADKVLAGKTNYVFKNTGTETTFVGKLIAGSDYSTGDLGLYSSIKDANYDFGASTIFNVDYSDTTSNGSAINAIGAVLKADATFAGNVVFNVKGQSHNVTAGNGIGLDVSSDTPSAAVALTVAEGSSFAFNVDSSVGGNATGIQVKNHAFTIQSKDENGSATPLGTANFVFNVGADNAKTSIGVDLQSGGSIAGDLIFAQGSIGNTTAADSTAIAVQVSGTGTISNQSIVVAEGILNANTNYVYKNSNTTSAISFTNTVLKDGEKATNHYSITAGNAESVTSTYGLYSGLENVYYDFGVKNPSEAGTTFTVSNANEGADVVGAIIAKNAVFVNKASFDVDGTTATGLQVKDSTLTLSDGSSIDLTIGKTTATTATAIQLDGANIVVNDTNGAKFAATNVGNKTNTTTTIALASSGTSEISGSGIIFTGTLGTKTDGQTEVYYLKNTGNLTFNQAEYNVGGALAAATEARVGLSNSEANAVFDFGTGDNVQTTFIVRGSNFNESGATKVSQASAIGASLTKDTTFKGNVVFDVQGGTHTDTTNSSKPTVTTGTGTGFNVAQTTNLTLDSAKITLNVDSGYGDKGEAYGLKVDGASAATILSVSSVDGSALGTSTFVFNVGNSYATTARAISLTAGASYDATIQGDSIVISSGTIGNRDYASEATAVYLNENATLNGQSIIVGKDVSFVTKKNGKAYVLNNAGSTQRASALSFNNNANETSGNSTITAGEVLSDAGTYGLYNNIANVSYNFGTSSVDGNFGTTFTVTAQNNGSDASGIVLAANANFEGKAQFTVHGGENSSGVGGAAYGIKTVAGDTTITLAENSVLSFDIQGGKGSSEFGKSTGIYAYNGALTIVSEGTGSTKGKISFSVGDYEKKLSTGIELDHGVFDGTVDFTAVKAKDEAYGILNSKESIIKKGTISFDSLAFRDVKDFAVIQNEGTLTISRDANIVAGKAVTTLNGKEAYYEDFNVGIYNDIAGATYNLGNLNLEVGKASGTTTYLVNENGERLNTSGTVASDSNSYAMVDMLDYAIYSADETSNFNVAANSTVNISAVDNRSTKAFGGSVNLNLEDGVKVYLGTDGGVIDSLSTNGNATIYLSGANKQARVGAANELSFRTLTINSISSSATTRAAANTVEQGANFVVLADATRQNGSKYSTYTGALTTFVQGSAYTASGAVSTTGGSDRIIINYDAANKPSVSAVNSTLGVGVSSLNTSGEKKYVVLAQVANTYTNITDQNGDNTRLHNLVTFNGLQKDGDITYVQSQVGFDVATVAIQRHDLSEQEQINLSTQGGEDWSNVGAVYVSDLDVRTSNIDTDIASATVSAINTNFDLISANLNSLSKRLGELRNTDNAHGLWGRVFAGEQTSKFGIEQTSTYLTFQAGYDYNIDLESGANYVGFALSYVHSSSKQASAEFVASDLSTKITGNASASSDGVEFAVYNSYVADNGLYSDSIVKFGYFTSDLSIPAQSDTYKVDNLALALSEEVGYKVSLGAQNEWFITPQAELAYVYVNGSEFTQNIGTASLKTTQDALSMLRTRVGAAWGYNFDHYGKDKGIKASLYLGTYYAYDAIMGGKTSMETNNGTTQEYSDLKSNGRFVLNVGTDIAVQDSTKFYVDFEKSFGSTMQTDYQVSVGVRFGFGEKASSKKEDKTKTALKPKELEENTAE